MLPTKFQDNWPFGSGEEAKKKKKKKKKKNSKYWISISNDFSYCLMYKSPQCFLPSFKSLDLSVQKKIFQDSSDSGHLGFRIGMILATSDLQVTLLLHTKLQVNWGFGSGEEVKNRF